eukprot:TRINITY_DN9858_c0_g5_i1.p1 TRINITY_DN9858_c0_g5~~TRINITY_DN9858_c0_g5_i1.p1  ORF type:complete len:391 (+),score=21.75 TRINITY_DN9858_c0_g5_i1:42-1175(+)
MKHNTVLPPERLTKGEVKYKRKLLKLVSDGQIELLRSVASKREGGLNFSEVRRKAWPLLVGIDERSCKSLEGTHFDHPEATQIDLDLNRSLHSISDDAIRDKYRAWLRSMLLSSLTANGTLEKPRQYYQGLHDIAAVLLLHLGVDVGGAVLERLVSWHLNPWMEGGSKKWTEVLDLIPSLMRKLDSELGDALDQGLIREGLGCTFALPWLITWMTHTYSNKIEICARLLDYLLSTTPLTIVYLCAVAATSRRDCVLEHTETTMQYATLNSLPSSPMLEAWISTTHSLYASYPPRQLISNVYGRSPPSVVDPETSPLFVLPADPQQAPVIIKDRLTQSSKRRRRHNLLGYLGSYMVGSSVAVLSAYSYYYFAHEGGAG